MARPSDSERASQLKEFMETYRNDHGGHWPSDYAVNKQFGWGAGVITRIRRLLAESGMTEAADSPEPDREDQQKSEILNQLNQVLRPVVDTLHEHTLGREQRTREQLNGRLRERGQTLERISRELAGAQVTIQKHEATIEQGRQQVYEHTEVIKELEADVAQRGQDIKGLKQRVVELTDARDTLQATEHQLLGQLETLHKSHVEQRELDRQRSETEKNQIRQTLVQAQTGLQSARNEIVTLSESMKDEHHRLLQERAAKQAAQDDARIAREAAETNGAKVDALQSKIGEFEKELNARSVLQEKLETRLTVQDEYHSQQRELMETKDDLIGQLKSALLQANRLDEGRDDDRKDENQTNDQ